MWSSLTVNRERFTAELQGDFLLATELADHLVGQGVPFREAHRVAGQLVKSCEARGENLSALTLDELRAVEPRFGDDALSWLDPEGAVERRTSQGGTAWSQVEAQVEALRDELDERDL